ncbi:MAG: Phytoene dehydrogenase and related proteins [uncultured Thermomicrobiales bacterium]|uniref:Phytoene dehydrogenase and related proteins n=1 Tax=uncultured Thermomicrobiales bacterium TaxID=1645740 RepID=A0A6J4TJZ5_9BACT|nr:MAG: Phytoene dehydrogenase and related proteins [uncultured Thermomicrobiales bacterium]
MPAPPYDAVVVGAGPNGLAAAITLARAGRSVLVLEANDAVGGGARSAGLTLPGFVHDLGSAIHPLALASPFFRTLPLDRHGLRWIQPEVPLAHPLDGHGAVLLERAVAATAAGLGEDAAAYAALMAPLVRDATRLIPGALAPLRVPRHPLAMARFGLLGVRSAERVADRFAGERARALLAGSAAHSFLRLDQSLSAAFGLILTLVGHAVGWPIPAGGSQSIADALAAHLRELGGEIRTGFPVASLVDVPDSRVVLFDLTPRQVLAIAGDALPPGYRRQLGRFRHGPGAFKLDYALDGPIPWTDPACLRAGTVHLGGALEEIAAGERAVRSGRHPERPFVLLAQQSLFDPSRAPAGQQTVWAYCHVPNGSTQDMTAAIEAQIERFAPGFRDRVLARVATAPADLQRQNATLAGGDINGGVQDWRQLFTRPAPLFPPYATPNPRLYFCSASTPPGGGVHGMCGHFAAKSALSRAW